ncbi:hypothetical protein VCR20J5_160118 [Vibrio crassostreae]|nr:hypothetical protein VCR15J5_110019 [Vibrio crassostreae]CDT25071.1 hypothetical protein VCR20J5_160118 [Vibrio crassostreae]
MTLVQGKHAELMTISEHVWHRNKGSEAAIRILKHECINYRCRRS